MNKIKEVLVALLDLARMVKSQPNEKAKIEAMQKSVSEKLKGAGPKDVMHVCDEITIAGFSSKSDSMEPDGMGGSVWSPEQSRIYCDCFFRLVNILEKSGLAKERDLCRKVLGNGMNLSILVSFCRWLKLTEPLPNLLSFEGRNEAAQMLRPKMRELTEYILSLNGQAKELGRQNRYDEAKKARENAERLNGVYGKMDKFVLPWLERKERSTVTLGMSLSPKEEDGGGVSEALKEAIGEATEKKNKKAPRKKNAPKK